MALDGIAISAVVSELKALLIGGRIDKIYQPHKDEILMSVRNNSKVFKILFSANPNQPRINITKLQYNNPITAPLFCMVLRKHISGGRISQISQYGLERIVKIDVDAVNDMGDNVKLSLITEIMSKHSNIILTDQNNCVIDSIKRVTHEISSVREILPKKIYVTPPSQNKIDPLEADFNSFYELLIKSQTKTQQFIYKTYMGISPMSASEIAFNAGVYSESYTENLSKSDIENLYNSFNATMDNIKENSFSPEIICQNDKVIDFYPFCSNQFGSLKKIKFNSMSELLEKFYSEKDNLYHIRQKSHDMRRIVLNNIERCVKKEEIQLKTINDAKHMDTWRLKGELITANIYSVKKGDKKFEAVNYYDDSMPKIDIELDENLSPSENAQIYYNKYNKAKRALAAVEIQKKQNEYEKEYLESVLSCIDLAETEAELDDIKTELVSQGFIKNKTKTNNNKKQKKSKPLHYVSSDGYDIFVGKSNTQNDELTLHTAKNSDIWLHTKNIPGSHVIISTNGNIQVPDNTLLQAAMLAAFYSKAKTGSNVPVDYTPKKFVKKPSGAKPGMVIYEKNNTIYVTPDVSLLPKIMEGSK